MQRSQQESPVYKELEEIKERNKLLKKQITDIYSDIKTYRERIQTAQSKDESALMIERYLLEKKINELKFQKDDLDKKLQEEKKKYSNCEKENKKMKEQHRKLEQKDVELKELAAEIEKKKKQISEIQKAIEKRRKEVQVTIDSAINKIPVLIDLSVDKICIFNTQGKTQRTISRKSPLISELVIDAISHLRLFAPEKYYFVILVKPSAADYIDFFLHSMQQEIKNVSYGLEPILENEGVTNE